MQHSETIGKILKELIDIAEKQEIREPDFWLDKAQMLATLWTTITDDITRFEMKYKKEIVDLIETGDSVAKATLKVEATSENYRTYRYLKKKDEQINNVIMIAKKRVDLHRL